MSLLPCSVLGSIASKMGLRGLWKGAAKSVLFDVFDVDGERTRVGGRSGETLLSALQRNNIFIEGACGGVCACATCHVVIDRKTFGRLQPASEREEDMLENAYGRTQTSRLACQVPVDKSTAGMAAEVPGKSRNISVDGYRPMPH
ncbi:MAG: 2Fe-2S ferredoxin [Amphiamblys sp. WSBS2006]|nr:MAG: 2Fe-2S ferredoxin [Amphiamblys sp. WSBS2006]